MTFTTFLYFDWRTGWLVCMRESHWVVTRLSHLVLSPSDKSLRIILIFSYSPNSMECLLHMYTLKIFIYLCTGTGVWTQGFALAKQVLTKQALYCLTHTPPVHFALVILEMVSCELCPGWLWTVILLISASQVARITGVNHWPLVSQIFFHLFILYPTCNPIDPDAA
jgi:hypothetical protein